MNLSDRKKQILQIVVDDYINTATPISSKQIKEEHITNISSATIRNELSVLEDMGYLMQPHHSAGRVPSAKAYELYVQELMSKEVLTEKELEYITGYFDIRFDKVETLVEKVAKVISEVTNYTTIAVTSRSKDEIITDIRLIRITDKQSLLVVVIDNRIIKDVLIDNPEDIDNSTVESAALMLGNMYRHKTVQELINSEKEVENEFHRFRYLFKSMVDVIKEYMSEPERKLICEGQSKMLQYPEFNNIEKAKVFLDMIDSKKKLMLMLEGDADNNSNIEISINIGKEDSVKEIPTDCAVITATYKVDGKVIGSAGVIGPSRMKYGKVISVLDGVGNALSGIKNNSTFKKSN